MSNLFKKVACFTDIHFGLRNNSRQHNTDCEEFVLWFIKEAKKAKKEIKNTEGLSAWVLKK